MKSHTAPYIHKTLWKDVRNPMLYIVLIACYGRATAAPVARFILLCICCCKGFVVLKTQVAVVALLFFFTNKVFAALRNFFFFSLFSFFFLKIEGLWILRYTQ